jgi:DNA-binding transcriptional ArsR family regulator
MIEWFVIKDLEDFTDKARAIVYNNFGLWNKESEIDILIDDVVEQDKEEFDKVLSHQESLAIVKQIVKKQKHKNKKNIRYLLNEKLFTKIVEDLNSRMVSNIINSLVKKGLVESAFDEKTNDFIFWVKEDDTKEQDKPETD